MKLTWFNTSIGTLKLYLAYEYVQYKVVQDIREIELRDSGSNANNRYVSRFEPLLYVPAFTQKDFHNVHTGPSIKGTLLRNYNTTLGVHYSSLKHNHLYTRGIGTKPKLNHNHIYTRG